MMMRKVSSQLRRFARAADGVAAVEFALVVPVFILFCVGIFEAGRMMWIRNSIQTATEEATRYAMAHTTSTDEELVALAEDYFDSVSIDDPSFTIARDTTGGVNFVTVRGTYTFEFKFTFFDFGDIELDGKSRVPLIS
jgi:Flp pilus assembly protein TadG